MHYIQQFESLLRRLDHSFGSVKGTVPGAIVCRCLLEGGGVGWMLCLGTMNSPKSFFRAKTIRGCVGLARKAIKEGKTTPLTIGQALTLSSVNKDRKTTPHGRKTSRRTARKAQ